MSGGSKCDRVFAEYFQVNWRQRREPLAFLLYDPPPTLQRGAPVFIHSDERLRLIASFRDAQFVAGHKQTVDPEERIIERERIWQSYRVNTVSPPSKQEFDEFWEGQDGVRSLFLMDEIVEVTTPVPFKVYGRALQWGYPRGVGYRYLTMPESLLLLRVAGAPLELRSSYLDLFLHPLNQGQGSSHRRST